MEPESGLNENQSHTDNIPQKRQTSNSVRSTKSKIDVELIDIEADEENLKPYTFSKQFLKMDLDKIRELIDILEEYCLSLSEKDDIDLEKTAKQRLILLKKIEKEKMMMEAKIIYSNQLELMDDKMKEELDTYKLNSEEEFNNLMQRFKEKEAEIKKLNKEELEEYKQNFEQTYSQIKPKPSKECLNWMKIRKCALKQNKFNKAQEADKEVERLNNIDLAKFNENKEKKLNLELAKIKHRHDNERKVYEMKKNLIITEFNENKQKEIEKIKRKYISKISELKNYQNFEISNFDKITKGVIKPCSRIQNIVSSATGIKDEDDEKNENENENKNEEKKEDNNNNIENDKKEQKDDALAEKEENKEENEDNNININEEIKEDNQDENLNENRAEDDVVEKEGEGDAEEYINKED